MDGHAGNKFKCSVHQCGKEYNSRSGLNLHVKIIHLGIRFGCNFCSSKFLSKTARDNHIVSVHTRENGFKCKKCPAKFSTAQILQVHGFVHSEERPHKCMTCSKQFKQKCVLTKHIKTVHTIDRSRVFECSICQKRFFQVGYLKRHSLVHDQDGAKFGCYFCKKGFNNRSELEVHTRIHTQEKPFSCKVDTCQYSTTNAGNLKRHAKRNHSPVEGRPQSRTWSCYFCSNTLCSFTILVNHLRVHTLEQPFSCGLCQKRFKYQIILKHHISSHTMEKPYSCKECKKSFVLGSSLKDHIGAVHRKEKRFFCKFCNFSSYKKNQLV